MKSLFAFILLLDFAGPLVAGEATDLKKLQSILRIANNTLPGDELENLAEQASGYVTRAPNAFLSAQIDQTRCFGVNFLGAQYADNQAKRSQELAARRTALNSVSDPRLAATKARCLAELAGS